MHNCFCTFLLPIKHCTSSNHRGVILFVLTKNINIKYIYIYIPRFYRVLLSVLDYKIYAKILYILGVNLGIF